MIYCRTLLPRIGSNAVGPLIPKPVIRQNVALQIPVVRAKLLAVRVELPETRNQFGAELLLRKRLGFTAEFILAVFRYIERGNEGGHYESRPRQGCGVTFLQFCREDHSQRNRRFCAGLYNLLRWSAI